MAVARGSTQKITGASVSGEIFELANIMIDQLAIFAADVKKVARSPYGGQASRDWNIWQEIT